jgi:hypothetical protein
MFLLKLLKKTVLTCFVVSVAIMLLLTRCSVAKEIIAWQKTWFKQPIAISAIPSEASPFTETLTAQLARQLNIGLESIKVDNVQPMIWSDTCLGLKNSVTRNCENIVTSGFRITLKAAGNSYVYHVSSSGTVIEEKNSP